MRFDVSWLSKSPGSAAFNCTGSVATCYHPVGPHPSPQPTPAAPPVPVTMELDATATPTAFPPFWKRPFGSGHARLSLRPSWQAHLKQAVTDLGLIAGFALPRKYTQAPPTTAFREISDRFLVFPGDL